jgi:hypothetical protein
VYNSLRLFGLMVLLVLAGLVATPARAAQDMVQFGSTIEVAKDSSIHDAVCFFCGVNIHGTVRGDTVVFFGNVRIDGEAKHDVVVFFGDVTAANDTSISHDLVNFFGKVHLGENTTVGQDAVVMFGSLEIADSASVGGNRVVQPGFVFWIPLLVIVLGITFIVHEVRESRRRRILRRF